MRTLKPLVLCLALAALVATPIIAVTAEMEHSAMPAATGTALWNHLTQVKYRESFTLWPGKGELYKGTEPHGALLTTYVNKPALDAIQGKKGTMPAGAIVVKENYMPDKKLAAITVMYKVAGFNPEAADWFWAKYTPDGKIEAEGKAAMCIGCHGTVKANDFIYTGQLK